MKKKLITEISRNRQLMGLLTEQPMPRLGDDVSKLLLKRFAKVSDRAILDDIEQLSRITSRQIRVTDNEYVQLVSRLIRSSNEMADIIVPKIINGLSPAEKNFIANFKGGIRNFRTRGGSYDQVLRNINTNLNARVNGVPVFNTQFPEVMNYLKRDLERYAYEVYHPTMTSLERRFDDYLNQWKSGWRAGKDSKSGGLLFGKQIMKGLGYAVTFGKSPKWFPRVYKNLNDEERKILLNWSISGMPDWGLIKKTWKDMGGVAASGVAFKQLWQKFKWVAGVVTILRFLRTFIEDNLTPEKEYEGWNDKTGWGRFLILCHRFYRAIDWPSFGVTSPAAWFAHLIITILFSGGSGGQKDLESEVKEYIIGSDESDIPKSLQDWYKSFTPGWFRKNRVKSNIDTTIQNSENTLDTLLSGQNVDTTPIVLPDTVQSVPVNVDSDTISSDW
jgi:hypothetical protein